MATSFRGLRPMAENGAAPRGLQNQNHRLRILVIEGQNPMLDVLSDSLRSAGYYHYSVASGQEALQEFQFARPDLILLGLDLPDMDGKEVLRRLREWTTAPIIVTSGQHEESEKIKCLDAGADDYLTKPFAMGELLARLRAALRRAFGVPRCEVFTAGRLKLNFTTREVFAGDEQVKLSAKEYDLLKVLASHAGLVRTHYQLIHELWGTTQYQDGMHLLRVTMSNLRRKLGRDSGIPRPIVTEPGVGYRLRPDSEWTRMSECV